MANQVLRCDSSAGDAYVEYDLGADHGIIWVRFNMWVPAAARAFFAANPNAIFLELLDAAHVTQEQVWLQADGISTTTFSGYPLIPTAADGWHSYISSYDYLPASFGGYHWGDRFSKDNRVSFAAGLSLVGTNQIRYVRLGVQGSSGDPDAVIFFDQFRVATAFHLNDIGGLDNDDVWALTDFEGGFFGAGSDAGTTVVGDCTIVDDPDTLDGGTIDYTEHGAAPQPAPTTNPRIAVNAPTPFDSEVGSGLGHYVNRIRNGGADGKTDVALLNTFYDALPDQIAVAGPDAIWGGRGAVFTGGPADAVYLAPRDRWVVCGSPAGGGAERTIATSPDLSPGSFTYRDLGDNSGFSYATGLAYDRDADIVVAVGIFTDDGFATAYNAAYSTDGGETWTPAETPWDVLFGSSFGMATPVGVAFSPTLGLWGIAAPANPVVAIITAPDPTGVWSAAPSDWDALGAAFNIEWLPAAAKFAIVGSTVPLDGVDGSPARAASLSPDGATWTMAETAFDGGPGAPSPGTAGPAYGITETPEGIYLVGWATFATDGASESVVALSTDNGLTFPAAPDALFAPVSSGDFYFQGGTAIAYRASGDLLWVGGGAILDDVGAIGPMVLLTTEAPPAPAPRRGLWVAPASAMFDLDPELIRLDGLGGEQRLTTWKVDRGRSRELDKTDTGTSVWDICDRNGDLDPTVLDGLAGSGGVDPMRQAGVFLWNPVTDQEASIFRGYVDDLDVEMELNAKMSQVKLELVDGFGALTELEMHPTDPPRFGTTPALESTGDIYFPPSDDDGTYTDTYASGPAARIHRALDEAGWPAERRRIAEGNVNLQQAVYERYDQLLSVIADAAEAEFPGGVALAYMSKDGIVCFNGRYVRFDPDFYLAASDAHRRPNHPLVRWRVGGAAAAAADDGVALIAGLGFGRGASDILNAVTTLPQGVEASDVPHATIQDDDSIAQYGYRGASWEDLLVLRGSTSGKTAVEECKDFSRYYVHNYKQPHTRIRRLKFRPRDPRSFSAAATWALMCGVEIGDPIDVVTSHWGGRGGFDARYFVEGIHYEGDAQGRVDLPNVTLVLDVSPAEFYAYNPFA